MKSLHLKNKSLNISTSSTTIVGINPRRRYILIQNRSLTESIYITFGGDDATVSLGVMLPPTASYESTLELKSEIKGITEANDADIIVVSDQLD